MDPKHVLQNPLLFQEGETQAFGTWLNSTCDWILELLAWSPGKNTEEHFSAAVIFTMCYCKYVSF